VATVSCDRTVKIWNVSNHLNWTLTQAYTSHSSSIYALEFLNHNEIATGSADNTTRIWSLTTGYTNKIINTSLQVTALQLLSNGLHLTLGHSNGNINIYSVANGSLIISFIKTSWVIDFTVINPVLLASSHGDTLVRIWNLTSNNLKFILRGHTNQVYGLKLVSSDIVASGSWDNTIKLWNITNGTLIRTLSNHTNQIRFSVDVLNDSQILVSGSYDQTIKTWNVSTGELLKTISTGLQIRSLAVIMTTQSIKLPISISF